MFHKNVLPADNHGIVSWSVADATALAALSLVPDDIGKVAVQLSPYRIYLLQDDSPAAWLQIYPAVAGSVTAADVSVVDSGGFYIGSDVEDILAEIAARIFQGYPIITEATAGRTIGQADSRHYIRFTATGAKTCDFDSAENLTSPEEYTISNRAASGNLTLGGTGITLNPPKGGTLVLEPGDTVTVKILSGDVTADVMGSTEAL